MLARLLAAIAYSRPSPPSAQCAGCSLLVARQHAAMCIKQPAHCDLGKRLGYGCFLHIVSESVQELVATVLLNPKLCRTRLGFSRAYSAMAQSIGF
jgi:hypothetical protein